METEESAVIAATPELARQSEGLALSPPDEQGREEKQDAGCHRALASRRTCVDRSVDGSPTAPAMAVRRTRATLTSKATIGNTSRLSELGKNPRSVSVAAR